MVEELIESRRCEMGRRDRGARAFSRRSEVGWNSYITQSANQSDRGDPFHVFQLFALPFSCRAGYKPSTAPSPTNMSLRTHSHSLIPHALTFRTRFKV